ncbi:hypothetical protein BGW38_009125, partial [Lunasporangiospora selenospora]
TKRSKPKVDKTSRASRETSCRQERIAQAAAEGTDPKIQERSRNLGSIINDGLKSLCETVSLSKGDTRHLLTTHMAVNLRPSVEAYVAAGHALDFKQSPDDDQSTLCDHVISALKEDIEDTLTQTSRLYTDLGRICIYATEYYISKIMAEHSDIGHRVQRMRAFQAVLKGQDFFRTLAVALYSPSRMRDVQVKEDSALARQIAATFELDFGAAAQKVLERVRKLLDGTVHMHVIEEIARNTSDGIRTQAQHFITTLKSR